MYKGSEAHKAYQRAYYLAHREDKLFRAKKRYGKLGYRIGLENRRNRMAVLNHYGLSCACCGEKTVQFLGIDHMNGGGNQHRKKIGGGSRFYQWLRQQGFPTGYQTLCHNCNMAKGFYGECPHASILQSHSQRCAHQEMAFLGRSESYGRKVAGSARWL